MSKVSIYDLKPGMVLAEDLLGNEGRFLMAKGATLEEKHLTVLKTWGVTEAAIVGLTEAEPGDIAPSDEIKAQAVAHLAPTFANNDLNYSPVAEIHRLCVERLAGRLASGRGAPEAAAPNVPEEWLKPPRDPAPPAADLAARCSELVTLPDIYFRIVEVLDSPNSSLGAIADVVEKDPGLSAKLLRLVNSSFYGFPYKIDSIAHAVGLLGSNELSTLAMGISVLTSFDKLPAELTDMGSFWRHSVACGVFARILARHKPMLSEARFFMAGILHDVGKLVIYSIAPEYARTALALSLHKNIPQHAAEKAVLGYDHSVAGAALLRRWKIPASLGDLVAGHHSLAGRENLLEIAVVHVADVLAVCLEMGGGLMRVAPPLLPKGWEALGLSENVFPAAVAQGVRQYREIMKLLIANGVANG